VQDSGVTFTFMPEAPLPDAEPTSSKTSRRMIWRRFFYTSGTTGFPKGAMTSHANSRRISRTASAC